LSTKLGVRIVKYCVGLTFVACLSTLIAYAVHGWTWNSKFAGGRLTVSVPEFVIAVVLITLVIGISVDMWRSRNPTEREQNSPPYQTTMTLYRPAEGL